MAPTKLQFFTDVRNALLRMTDKDLACEGYIREVPAGECGETTCRPCAMGAYFIAAATVDPSCPLSDFNSERLSIGFRLAGLRSPVDEGEHIPNVNDGFMPFDNSPEARKARYNFMLSWLNAKISNLQGGC